jgi:phosphate starvation-inducible PhoH-like protein
VVLAVGPPGTGKTGVPCHAAADLLLSGQVRRIVVTSPGVVLGRTQLSTLSTSPHVRPVYEHLLDSRLGPSLAAQVERGAVEVLPLAALRGLTLDDCFVVADDMQDALHADLVTLLTRVGRNCKLVVTGRSSTAPSGSLYVKGGLGTVLAAVERAFETSDESPIHLVRFGEADIVRGDMARRILNLLEN